MTAERLTNWMKLRNHELCEKCVDQKAERKREERIQFRSILAGIVLAIVAKADLFGIIAHMDDPWKTLGWVRMLEGTWVRSPATADFGHFFYTLGGCILTGFALGFGSKFWHDILGSVYELRDAVRRARTGKPGAKPGNDPQPEPGNE